MGLILRRGRADSAVSCSPDVPNLPGLLDLLGLLGLSGLLEALGAAATADRVDTADAGSVAGVDGLARIFGVGVVFGKVICVCLAVEHVAIADFGAPVMEETVVDVVGVVASATEESSGVCLATERVTIDAEGMVSVVGGGVGVCFAVERVVVVDAVGVIFMVAESAGDCFAVERAITLDAGVV